MPRVTIRPLADPTSPIDVTDALTAAIAYELWIRFGGHDRLNWLEAERHLASLLGTPDLTATAAKKREPAASVSRSLRPRPSSAARRRTREQTRSHTARS